MLNILTAIAGALDALVKIGGWVGEAVKKWLTKSPQDKAREINKEVADAIKKAHEKNDTSDLEKTFRK